MTARVSTRQEWQDVAPETTVAELIAGSPDGLLHARAGDGTDPAEMTLCIRGGDRFLAGPATYAAVNLGSPDARASEVTCPDCRAWLHA